MCYIDIDNGLGITRALLPKRINLNPNIYK